MARSLNRWTGIGNMTRDLEVRYSADGHAFGNTAIAVNDSYKDKSGEQKEIVEFINLVFTGKPAEIVAKYTKKGSKLYVEGPIRTRKWTDKEGAERVTTEIRVLDFQFLDGKPAEGSAQEAAPRGARPAARPGAKPPAPQRHPEPFVDDDLDSIPF